MFRRRSLWRGGSLAFYWFVEKLLLKNMKYAWSFEIQNDRHRNHTQKHRKYFKRQFQLTRCRRVPLGLGRPRADMPRVVASWGSSINYNVSKEIYTHLICMYVAGRKPKTESSKMILHKISLNFLHSKQLCATAKEQVFPAAVTAGRVIAMSR